jgi:hypothetical protein
MTTASAPAPRASARRGLPEWVVAVGVGVAVALAMLVPFLQLHIFYYQGDGPESFVPLWHHFGTLLRQGHWPPMEPGGWYGGNYAGEAAYALWNPVYLLDYVLVSLFDDLAAGAALVQVQHLALLAVGVFLLCREYGARRAPAVVLAFAVPTSGFTLFYEAAGWPAGLTAFTWVAWFWWAAARQSRGRSRPLLTFVLGALAITTGNPYAALGVGIVVVGLAVELLVARQHRRLPGLLLTGACVCAVGALVFLPLLGALPVSERQTTAAIANDTFLVPHLGDILASSAPSYLPAILNWNGALLEKMPSTYFAWFLVPLLPWLRWSRLRGRGRPLTSLLVVTGIYGALSVGPSNLWLFRWPVRLIEYFYLGVGVLLALALSAGLARDHWRRRAGATAALVAAGCYLSFAVRPEYTGQHLLVAVLVLALLTAAVLAHRRRGLPALGAALVAGTVAVLTVQTALFPLGDHSGSGYRVPQTVSSVRASTTEYRGTVLQLAVETTMYAETPEQIGELTFGNNALMTGHETVVRYSGIGFETFYRALCMDYRGQVCPAAFDAVWRPVGDTGRPLVDLLRVDTLVIDARLFPGPAAAVPPAGWSVAARDDIRTVWVRDSPSPSGGRVSWSSPGVQVRGDTATDATEQVSYRAGTDGSLLFARLAWPGYTATVDGRAVAVRGGPAGLLAVDVPAGDHVLALRFRPAYLRAGAAIALLALVVVLLQTLLGVVLDRRRRRRAVPPAEDPSGPAVPLPGAEHAPAPPAPAGADR